MATKHPRSSRACVLVHFTVAYLPRRHRLHGLGCENNAIQWCNF